MKSGWGKPLPSGAQPSHQTKSSYNKGGSFCARLDDLVSMEREKLEQLRHVAVLKNRMKFSEDSLENAFVEYNAPRIKKMMLMPAILLTAYSIYSLFWSDWGTFAGFLDSWHTRANIAFNVTWVLLVLAGLVGIAFSLLKTYRVKQSEQIFMVWCLIVFTFGLLFGNRGKVARLFNVDADVAFEMGEETQHDSELLLVLSGIVIYLSLNVPMRFRVMAWVALYLWGLYASVCFAVDVFVKYGMTFSSHCRSAAVRTVCLSILYIMTLCGKYHNELVLRENFLNAQRLEHKKNVLRLAVEAVESSSSDGGQKEVPSLMEGVRRQLSKALKLVGEARFVGAGEIRNGCTGYTHMVEALDSVSEIIRAAEVNIVMSEMKWSASGSGEPLHSAARRSTSTSPGLSCASYSSQDLTEKRASLVPHRLSVGVHDELGTSARSLLREVGAPWAWKMDVFELEKSLHENGSTTLSAFELVGRAVLQEVRSSLKVEWVVVQNFLASIKNLYNDVAFHNSSHAAQVTHQASCLLSLLGVRSKDASPLEKAAFYVAGLCHDVGHFGRSERFLVESGHELACRYNDSSVLQNFHAATTFLAMRHPSSNSDILGKLLPIQRKMFRRCFLSLVLSMDPFSAFAGEGGGLKERLERAGEGGGDLLLLMQAALNAGDMGYHGCEWSSHKKWAHRLAKELYQEGEAEGQRGLPISPICDPKTSSVGSIHIYLISTFSQPLFEVIGNLVEARNFGGREHVREIKEYIEDNLERWRSSSDGILLDSPPNPPPLLLSPPMRMTHMRFRSGVQEDGISFISDSSDLAQPPTFSKLYETQS